MPCLRREIRSAEKPHVRCTRARPPPNPQHKAVKIHDGNLMVYGAWQKRRVHSKAGIPRSARFLYSSDIS